MNRKKILMLSLCLGLVIFIGTACAALRPLAILGLSAPYYSPDTIVITVGDTLVITNTGVMSHSVTSDSPGLFDTGLISVGGTATLTFNTLGDYAYHCSAHPAMIGMVRVISTQGEVDLANPTISMITAAEIQAAGGVTPITPYALSIDTDNFLMIDDDPSGGSGNFVRFNFLTRTGSVFANEADYTAVADTGDLDIQSQLVTSDGTFVIADRDTNDEILKGTGRTPPNTASNVAATPGIADMTGSGLDLYYTTEITFGGTDNVEKITLPGSTKTEVVSSTQILAATGAGDFGAGPIAIEPDGNLLIFDEAAYGGIDAILRANPNTGAVSIAFSTTNAFNGIAPGIEAMRVDGLGNIYCWNEYRSPESAFTFIKPTGQTFDYTISTVLPGLGITLYDIDNSAYGFTAVTFSGNYAYYFAGNTFGTPGGDIIIFRFPILPASIGLTPVTPANLNPGQTKGFSVTNGTPPYTWSLVTTSAGQGSLDTTAGASIIFTAGATLGPLRVAVTDSLGNVAWSDLITVTATSASIIPEPKEVIYLQNEPVGTITN